MIVEPITCLRPAPEHAASFAALPYDVFTDDEARSFVAHNPKSFLAIDRPETGFDTDVDPTAPEVYEHASKLLRDRQLDFTLVRDEKPCFYIYELSSGSHRQIGIMGAVSVDDYLDGTIRRHELTLAHKEEDRVAHIKATRAQTGPVFLAYRDSVAIDTIVSAATMAEPIYDFVSADDVRQRVWRIARPVAVDAIGVAFSTIAHAYIADGHHRAAAAARICQERRAEGRTDDPSECFLAVLFPASQLRILPYDRMVADCAGMDEDELLKKIADAGFVCEASSSEPVTPQERHVFGMYANNTWHTLRWTGSVDERDPVAALDVSILQEHVLAPLLGIDDPRTNDRISFFGGLEAFNLQRKTPEQGVAFTLFPTSLDDLMLVADAHELMPPKSTWFDPKLLSGLAIRRIW